METSIDNAPCVPPIRKEQVLEGDPRVGDAFWRERRRHG